MAHFSLFSGALPVCCGTQFGKHCSRVRVRFL